MCKRNCISIHKYEQYVCMHVNRCNGSSLFIKSEYTMLRLYY